jgi:hypothetical protein
MSIDSISSHKRVRETSEIQTIISTIQPTSPAPSSPLKKKIRSHQSVASESDLDEHDDIEQESNQSTQTAHSESPPESPPYDYSRFPDHTLPPNAKWNVESNYN